MWEKRSKGMLAFVMLTAGLVYVQMTLFVVQFIFHVRMPANLFNVCIEFLRFIGFPVRINVMLFLLLTSLLLSLAVWLREGIASFRWRKLLHRCLDPDLSQAIGEEHGLGPQALTVIDHPDQVAMTVGLLRPRIVLSTGLICELSESELAAVMAHEKYHLSERHPLKIFLLTLVGTTFWYIPIYRWLIGKYKMLIELMADRQAVRATGSVADLGSALLVMLKRGTSATLVPSSASFADNAINLRLKLLVDPHFKPPLRPPLIPCIVSLIAFVFVVFGIG
ncbi:MULTISPECIES: M56 family metallopeptidase [Paenibacillus]|jgi:Zn-dependent protease with chaperone function|uniref:Zn-dependent protease with chaperone function n=1 Tax=Paenibacillus favisporus TaxID=221028 RepID=A0ABV2F2D9_9BACL|nr:MULTISPECIES: M56 family metallopeptidase [Paenibacillus]PQP89776.1 peptidase M56 [Paenibacillus sp. AR247]GIO61322.1 hypothetical protein J43TS9_28960 [Paenibacillus cineris]